MSTRAIRRLREEREAAQKAQESESEEEEVEVVTGTRAAFLAMVDEESSSEEEEDDDDSDRGDDNDEENENKQRKVVEDTNVSEQVGKEVKKPSEPVQSKEQEEEEDLDALLAEFESHDKNMTSDAATVPSCSWFSVLVAGMDARDLDVDYVIRTSLLGSNTEDGPSSRASRRSARLVFGTPRDEWAQHRPPHYVGGGIGMTTYADDESTVHTLPWPYTQDGIVGREEADLGRWFTFLRSDTYRKDCSDFERIQQTGDVNALALYVAHHPFVTESLLQLCMVLYQTNQSQEGLSVLRRCLWIYECSTLAGFAPLDAEKNCFMDYDLKENTSYFHALFRLIQVSGVAGWIRTALATSRYLLSLDPLRDPMGVLLLLDYYALATMSHVHNTFVVDLVESQRIQVHHRGPLSEKHHSCDLTDLPNWSYSYALALYRLQMSEQQYNDYSLERANEAMVAAIQKFPEIVEALLEKNEVDTTGRSFQTDWPTVLVNLRSSSRDNAATEIKLMDPTVRRTASSACDLMIRIFVDRNHKLWSGNDVLPWLYRNCCAACEEKGRLETTSVKAAFARYQKVDPEDYQDRFRTLPQDANPLDPNLVGPALAIDPNRRRFLRQGRGQQHEQLQEQLEMGQFGGNALLGPPTHVIDPDWPLMEVLWRSMLPWARVDGVPPPRR